MYIEDIGESGFIKRIQSKFSTKDHSIVLGIGDDAAVISPAGKKFLLFSTDTLREDVHFSKKYCTFYDIGWKAVAVSISDIAAMGGVHKYLLLSIAVPYKTSMENLDGLLNGVADIMERYSVFLIRGNVTRTNVGVTIDTTVIGEINRGTALVRSGATVGDLIYITGTPGKSAVGLSLLKAYAGTNPTYINTAGINLITNDISIPFFVE